MNYEVQRQLSALKILTNKNIQNSQKIDEIGRGRGGIAQRRGPYQ